MAELTMSMLDDDSIHDFFGEEPGESNQDTPETPDSDTEDNKEDEPEEDTNSIETVNPDAYFGGTAEEKPEEDKTEEKADDKQPNDTKSEKNPAPEEGDNSSVLSNLAHAMKEQGLFSSLADDAKIESEEDFKKAWEEEINSRLTERQRNIEAALNDGINPAEIRKYNDTMDELNAITIEKLEEESTDAEEIRKTLIYYAKVNQGYSEEKAKKEVEKSLKAGTDIEDAKDALEFSKKNVQDRYDSVVNKQKKDNEDLEKARADFKESFIKSIRDDKEDIWGQVSDGMKQKAIDAVYGTKRILKESGKSVSELEYYEQTNPEKFVKNMALCFALTDGFTKMGNLLKVSSKQQQNGIITDIARKLKNDHSEGGSYKYANNASHSGKDSLLFLDD